MSNFFNADVGFSTDEEITRKKKAPKLDWLTNRCFSYVDDFQALQQRCEKRLQTSKGEFYAYPADYGIKIKDLINKPRGYVMSQLSERIKDALINDPEIKEVSNFTFEVIDKIIHVMFVVKTAYGDSTQKVSLET